MASKKSRFGTGGKRKSKKGKKGRKGHGRRLSAATRAKLSRKGKARWKRMSAAAKAKVLAGLTRGHRKASKKGKRGKGKKSKGRHLSAATRAKLSRKAKARARKIKRFKQTNPFAFVDWGKIGRAEAKKKSRLAKVFAAFGIGASKPAPTYTKHQSDYLARKRREMEARRAFAGAPIPAHEAYV